MSVCRFIYEYTPFWYWYAMWMCLYVCGGWPYKRNINTAIYQRSMSSCHTWCNSISCPPWGASAKCVHQVVYLRQPVVFLSTREEWNFSLWSSSKVELLHPEWGMITVLVRVVKASRMIVILTASHDDRFHSTPVVETPAFKKHMHWRKTDKACKHLQLCQLSRAVRVTQQGY